MQKNLFTVFPFYKYFLEPFACSGEFLYFFTVVAFWKGGCILYNGIKMPEDMTFYMSMLSFTNMKLEIRD